MTLREEIKNRIDKKMDNENFLYLERLSKIVGLDVREIAIRRWITDENCKLYKFFEEVRKNTNLFLPRFRYDLSDNMEILESVRIENANEETKRKFNIVPFDSFVDKIRKQLIDEFETNDTFDSIFTIVLNNKKIGFECETKIIIDRKSIECQLRDNKEINIFINNDVEYVICEEII